MPMEPALRDMLTQTITQAPYMGQDAYGKPSYGPPQSRPARVQLRIETLTNQQGQERVSNTTVICDGDVLVTVKDKITLPDGTSPTIQLVYSPEDPDSPGVVHHYELKL
jgi:hypothetical protein